jgi:hypothetical protein
VEALVRAPLVLHVPFRFDLADDSDIEAVSDLSGQQLQHRIVAHLTNCIRWSIGDISCHGIEAPPALQVAPGLRRTVLPMSPD